MKKHIIILLFCLSFNFISSQEQIMCSEMRTLIVIHNNADIPIINNNDNTITLTFPQQNITDVFSNYVLTDFYQVSPNGSEVLQKYYYIKHYSKNLIVDIKNNVSDTILSVDEVPTTSISQDLIDTLDGVTFDVIKHVTDTGDCTNEFGVIDCPYTDVPEDFNLSITFTYNAEDDTLHAESNQLSPCGNYFSTNLKGGDPNDVDFSSADYSLQTWENEIGTSTTSNQTDSCYYLENMIYGIMGVTCDYDYSYGNISISIDQDTGNPKLTRKMILLGLHGIELRASNTASVEENNFQLIYPYQIDNNPYLQISNLNNQTLKVEIYNISGQQIITPSRFKENNLNISNLSTGLYFIKLSNLDNQQKVFKFLKN